MTRKESSERYNALPKEHRVTVSAFVCEQEIRWLEREKQDYIKAHKANMKRINERIKSTEKWLNRLE